MKEAVAVFAVAVTMAVVFSVFVLILGGVKRGGIRRAWVRLWVWLRYWFDMSPWGEAKVERLLRLSLRCMHEGYMPYTKKLEVLCYSWTSLGMLVVSYRAPEEAGSIRIKSFDRLLAGPMSTVSDENECASTHEEAMVKHMAMVAGLGGAK